MSVWINITMSLRFIWLDIPFYLYICCFAFDGFWFWFWCWFRFRFRFAFGCLIFMLSWLLGSHCCFIPWHIKNSYKCKTKILKTIIKNSRGKRTRQKGFLHFFFFFVYASACLSGSRKKRLQIKMKYNFRSQIHVSSISVCIYVCTYPSELNQSCCCRIKLLRKAKAKTCIRLAPKSRQRFSLGATHTAYA